MCLSFGSSLVSTSVLSLLCYLMYAPVLSLAFHLYFSIVCRFLLLILPVVLFPGYELSLLNVVWAFACSPCEPQVDTGKHAKIPLLQTSETDTGNGIEYIIRTVYANHFLFHHN